MSRLKDVLEKLSNAHGVSGYENNVRQMIEDEIRPYVDDVRTDKMGNLIATRHGGSPRIMLAAHMDEIGLMAKYVDDKGFIYFTTTGGWFDQTLLSQRMIERNRSKRKTCISISGQPAVKMRKRWA